MCLIGTAWFAYVQVTNKPVVLRTQKQYVKANESEQEEITNANKKNAKTILENQPIIYSNDYDVFIPVQNEVDVDDIEKQDEYLSKNAISYSLYGTPGEGNYDVFAHHSLYEGQYFTSFVDQLQQGDSVYVVEKDGDNYVKYEYEIKYQYTVKADDTDNVYYPSDDPIITIGTCISPYKTNKRFIWQGDLTTTTEYTSFDKLKEDK